MRRRADKAVEWLKKQQPSTAEDRSFRLLGLAWGNADQATRRRAAADIIAQQRADGGWGQRSEMATDAYATGLSMYALQASGSASPDDPAMKRGAEKVFSSTQRADGSWFVASRSPKFQPVLRRRLPIRPGPVDLVDGDGLGHGGPGRRRTGRATRIDRGAVRLLGRHGRGRGWRLGFGAGHGRRARHPRRSRMRRGAGRGAGTRRGRGIDGPRRRRRLPWRSRPTSSPRPRCSRSAIALDDAFKGRINIAVNCAGINVPKSDSKRSRLPSGSRVQRVNTTGAFLFSRTMYPRLKAGGWGRLIHVTSIFATRTFPHRVSYASSKGALLQLTKTLALEWATRRDHRQRDSLPARSRPT